MLYAVTFPEYHDPSDAARVTAWRRDFDAPHAQDVVGHVMLVFGTDKLARGDFEVHVRPVAADMPPVPAAFAVPLIWPQDDAYLLFAVPQDGLTAIADLHDRLYSDPLAVALRTDLPYVPHMTLGRSPSYDKAAAARNDLRAGLSVTADIRSPTAIDTADGISQVASFPLGGRA